MYRSVVREGDRSPKIAIRFVHEMAARGFRIALSMPGRGGLSFLVL